jgi:hypothetical protein
LGVDLGSRGHSPFVLSGAVFSLLRNPPRRRPLRARADGVHAWVPRGYDEMSQPFNASSIAGLALWLKADHGLFKDLAKTQPAAPGDPVAVWADQSGQSVDATQATSAKRPTYDPLGMPGGFPALVFGTSYLPTWLTAPVAITANAFSYFIIVSKTDGNDNNNTYYSRFLSLFGGPYVDTYSDAAIAGMWNRDTNAYEIQRNHVTHCSIPFTPYGKGRVISCVLNAGSVTLRVDGLGSTGATDVLPTLNTNILTIGDGMPHGSDFALNGSVSELILYRRALSGSERQTVETYLTARLLPPSSSPTSMASTMRLPGKVRPRTHRLFRSR